jgi:hypothetical protein
MVTSNPPQRKASGSLRIKATREQFQLRRLRQACNESVSAASYSANCKKQDMLAIPAPATDSDWRRPPWPRARG